MPIPERCNNCQSKRLIPINSTQDEESVEDQKKDKIQYLECFDCSNVSIQKSEEMEKSLTVESYE